MWVWVREPCLDLKINACSLVLSCCLLFLRFVFCFHFNFTGFLSARADELNYLPRGLHTHTRVTRGGARANWICCMKPTKCSNKLLNNCWTNCCKVEKREGEGWGDGKITPNRQKFALVWPKTFTFRCCATLKGGSMSIVSCWGGAVISTQYSLLHSSLDVQCTLYTLHFVHLILHTLYTLQFNSTLCVL